MEVLLLESIKVWLVCGHTVLCMFWEGGLGLPRGLVQYSWVCDSTNFQTMSNNNGNNLQITTATK